MRVSAFSVSNGFLTNLSDYSIADLFLFVKKRKEGAAFLPNLRGRGILPPFDETLGYIWAINYNPNYAMRIMQTLELTTFFWLLKFPAISFLNG